MFSDMQGPRKCTTRMCFLRSLLNNCSPQDQERRYKIWGPTWRQRDSESRVMGMEIPDDSCKAPRQHPTPCGPELRGLQEGFQTNGEERFPNVIVLRGILDCFRRVWHELLISTQKTKQMEKQFSYFSH